MEKRRMTKEEREEQIIQAAKEVFIERGYMGATTLELAKRANISEVTLFRYFPSKSELFLATISPIMAKSIELVLQGQGYTPIRALKEFLKERIFFIAHNREIIKLLLIESEMHHELSEQVNIIEQNLTMLKELVRRIGLPEEQNSLLLRMTIGMLTSFLFIPIENEWEIERDVQEFLNRIDFLFIHTVSK
ncbi:TetR/AcrR family transcriptional regulator [Tepidibacillus infernus]|uniref:HTH tetR-type domain-containing protein n=1 Tax=Tepidibacillus decaturensis TaxID=1413211 RepID=A0A135L6S0_9BACI|nr:TetR/AcrR family transcriptional regulator [Tepidibacillus decaturensis]KXG44513.1 hypothetical protein U473_11165 [Tepidibacillus decaturensis]